MNEYTEFQRMPDNNLLIFYDQIIIIIINKIIIVMIINIFTEECLSHSKVLFTRALKQETFTISRFVVYLTVLRQLAVG